ncbi:uncharacterized protein LOC108890048 isoform X2 [Lates calcarifer]|uniref:Uncharacterized protein LOC108890048 isoform X2 n=1 Tax=Lates calcarifer TaxID=8187 RepID=A0AAJ7PZ01_LATCA|nr:uncharacterized protein LOC108890048 isoform X2 [Lates calcarifer]
MKTAAFIIGLIFICCQFTEQTAAEGFKQTVVQSECRDRYLWIQVTSVQMPRFEAVDGNGVHSISEQLASHCGYTISTFKRDGFTTFRASYYSCFTQSQNDEVFTFRFNVIVSDGSGGWLSHLVSEVCSGLIWTHREIICEEDYMEVNVDRESSCGGQWGESGQVWQAALSQSDGQVSSMSISEAQNRGYSLTTTAQRVVLRSSYKQSHAQVITVDGIPVEVIQISLFFKKKLTVVMIDMSMACTVNSGSFDGAWLLWDIPWVMTPLVERVATFESRSLGVGVEGVLLDEPTATTRGFSLVQQGRLVQIGVPFGAEGGYWKSLVVNNMYKERYMIFVLYEHIFSLLYEDGSSIDTRHRMLRELDTPLLCRPPFSLDQTISDDQVFSIYLGNIPADVILEEVWINRKQLMIAESIKGGISISPVVHANGSRAYKLQLPFEDNVVHWMYLGGGVVQYSIDINFTLTIMPQRDSYHHHTSITAQVFDAFPPEITAQCSDGGIAFSVVRPPRAKSLWEVGVNHEPLTSQLAAQRGYHLHNDAHKTTLEVPVFSIGYTYEGINLANFYGTFKLLLRDSKTLEVQTSTSKRCLFKTEDMMVCSADGTMTVVTTLTSTWPMVQPERTSLLDPTCEPKQVDGSRVLFEFKVDSCGTRAMVGESYMVYENEILHDRQLIVDGPNFISRESQFKLTVRCFYPLSGVNRLSVDRIFRSETPGFGSIKVFESLKDSSNKVDAHDCSHQDSGYTISTPTNQVQQTPAARGILPHPAIRPQPKLGSSHFIRVPGGHNKLVSYSKELQTFPILNPSPDPQTVGAYQVPQQISSHPGHLMSKTEGQNIFNPLSSFAPRYDQVLHSSIQLSNLNTPSLNFAGMKGENSGPRDDIPALVLDSLSGTPDSPVSEQLQSSLGSSAQILSHHGSSGGGTEMANMEERAASQPQSLYDPFQASNLHQDLQSPTQDNPDLHSITGSKLILPSRERKYVPADTKHKNTIPDSSRGTQDSVSNELTSTATSQVDPNLERTGSIERRNIETFQSRVQNIRVKPTTKFVSSGHLNHKPVIKQTNAQIFNPSQYSTGLTAVSNDGNHWTSQQLQDHRGPNTRQEHLPGKTGFQKLKQEQGVHSFRVKLHQSASVITDLSPNQQGHQQKPVHQKHQQILMQSVAETGNRGGQEFASSLRNVLHPTGTSHIRVRPGPGLSGGVQIHYQSRLQNLQNPDSVSSTLQNTSNIPVNIREYKPADTNIQSNPTAGGAGYTGPDGSTDMSSDPVIHTSSDCGSPYGSSVHQGIMRGKLIS